MAASTGRMLSLMDLMLRTARLPLRNSQLTATATCDWA